MDETRGNRVLSGAWGRFFFDGEPLFEVVNVSADVEIQRAEIQRDGDWDSKITGTSCTINFEVEQVYSRTSKKLIDAYKKGIDPRYTASITVADPDAVGGQRETVNIGNMWINNFNLANFTKGEVINKTYEGGFTLRDSDLAEGVF